MAIPDKYVEIMSKFQKALKTGDSTEIDKITLDELIVASSYLIKDKNYPYYAFLLRKIEQRERSVPSTQHKVPIRTSSNFGKNKDIFLAHRFEEEELINKLKNIIEIAKYNCKEGKRDDLGSISEDILSKIKNCGFFIALMTKMDELKSGEYTVSSWLLEEKGAALAFGHRPLIMVEEGVSRHYVGFLQSDDEMIFFNRENFDAKVKEAIKKIANTYEKFSNKKVPPTYISKEAIRNKDVLEKIINPLSIHLKELACYIKSLRFPPSYGIQYGRIIVNEDPLWNKIKQEHFYLLNNLNKEIRNELNIFSSKIKTVTYLYNQNFKQLNTILVNVLKPITGKDSYPKGVREAVNYQAFIGGKSIELFIPTLIFLDKKLEDYITEVQKDESLPNKRIEDEAFMINGLEEKDLGRKDFDDIVLTVKQKISQNPDIQKFIEESRKTYKEVERLIKRLEEEKK